MSDTAHGRGVGGAAVSDLDALIWQAVDEYGRSDLYRIMDETERLYQAVLDALYPRPVIVTTDNTSGERQLTAAWEGR